MDLFHHLFRPKAKTAGKGGEELEAPAPIAEGPTVSPGHFPLGGLTPTVPRWRLDRDLGGHIRRAPPIFRPLVTEVALSLDEVLPRVPTHALKPGMHDPDHSLRLPVRDLAGGIASGKVTVQLSELARLYPEYFEAPSAELEDAAISLPWQKLSAPWPSPALPPPIGEEPAVESPFSPASEPESVEPATSEMTPKSPSSETEAKAPTEPQSYVDAQPTETVNEGSSEAPSEAEDNTPELGVVPPLETPVDTLDASAAEESKSAAPSTEAPAGAAFPWPGLPARPIIRSPILSAPTGPAVPPPSPVRLSAAEHGAEQGRGQSESAPPPLVDAGAETVEKAEDDDTSAQQVEPVPIRPERAEEPEGAGPTGPRVSEQEPLQAIFMTDEDLDLPRIVELSTQLPGVTGCMILAGEHLTQGGEKPAGLDAGTLRELGQRLASTAAVFQDKLPAEPTFTLYGGNRALSLFTRPEFCLCVVHGSRGFLPGVRERLTAVADTLARDLALAAEC